MKKNLSEEAKMDNYNYQAPQKESGVGVAAMICGIVSFLCNPFYLVVMAAVILGIVGIATANGRPKGMAITGLILGIVATGCQIIIDILTLGVGFFF